MKRVLVVLLALVAVLAVSPVGVGHAAEAAKPSVQVQLWPEGEPGQMLVIVSAELAEGQKAPATVDLPLIEGAQVLWVGEVLGQDPNSDIQAEQKVVDSAAGKALRVELTKGTIAQYEAVIPQLTANGQKVTAKAKWVQTTEAPKTSFAVRLPAGADEVELRPAAPDEPQSNQAGETLHTLPDRALNPGDEVTIDISYVKGAVTAADGSGISDKTQLAIVLGVIALVAGGAAMALHARSRQATAE